MTSTTQLDPSQVGEVRKVFAEKFAENCTALAEVARMDARTVKKLIQGEKVRRDKFLRGLSALGFGFSSAVLLSQPKASASSTSASSKEAELEALIRLGKNPQSIISMPGRYTGKGGDKGMYTNQQTLGISGLPRHEWIGADMKRGWRNESGELTDHYHKLIKDVWDLKPGQTIKERSHIATLMDQPDTQLRIWMNVTLDTYYNEFVRITETLHHELINSPMI